MKRRILLVDDEVAVLLTLKAVLEISGYDVDTAASAREGKARIRTRQYEMIITDMRMESDQAGREVIETARNAPYQPAVALLTAFPMAEDDWQGLGADKMLVKPMQVPVLIRQLEKLLDGHHAKLKKGASEKSGTATSTEEDPVREAAPAKVVKGKVSGKAVAATLAPEAGGGKSKAGKPAKTLAGKGKKPLGKAGKKPVRKG